MLIRAAGLRRVLTGFATTPEILLSKALPLSERLANYGDSRGHFDARSAHVTCSHVLQRLVEHRGQKSRV
jgi:hypothetical protein